MKPPWEWNENDILELIKLAETESLTLDYKASKSLDLNDKAKNEISKDVSAFANSAGGTIVYGVIEKYNKPIRIDEGLDPNITSKEWLEQVINSRIRRRINGILINQIELINSNPGKVLYVVCIPQSKHAPHMANDNRFYKRFNFESVPMEEYEVRDIANRFESPDLNILIKIEECPEFKLTFSDNDYSDPVEMSIFAVNRSYKTAEYTVVMLGLDSIIKIESKGDFIEAVNSKSNDPKFIRLYKHLHINSHMPLIKDIEFKISNNIKVSFFKDTKKCIIYWEAYSSGMDVKRGANLIQINNKIIKIVDLDKDNIEKLFLENLKPN